MGHYTPFGGCAQPVYVSVLKQGSVSTAVKKTKKKKTIAVFF
jgi:hypothetical protein